jgi:hypothetical protein
MSESERSPLLSAAVDGSEAPEHRTSTSESAPLLQSSTSPGYDGTSDPATATHHDEQQDRDAGQPSAHPEARSKTRWPSVIAMIVLASLSLAIIVLAFILPSAVEEYAKQAAVVEPTNLSLESLTANGIRARIRANYRLDARRVENDRVRQLGRAATWLVGSVSTGEMKVRVYLPDYDNLLLGTAGLPPLQVNIRDGPENNVIDFVAELIPGDAEGIRMLANEWLEGRLDTVRLRGQADVQIKAGMIPLGTHTIVESLTFEGQSLYRSFASLYFGEKTLQ